MNPVKLDYGRYISNKLWNLFRMYATYSHDLPTPFALNSPLRLVDRYILSKCEVMARKMENAMDEFDIETACMTSVSFLTNTVCDFFVEYAKSDLKGDSPYKGHTMEVFRLVMNHVMNQLHLFLPHETEEINFQLGPSFEPLLQRRYFTESNPLRQQAVDTEAIQKVEDAIALVHDVRSLQKIIGDLRCQDTNESPKCGLLCKPASRLSGEQVEVVQRLTRLSVEMMETEPSFSQIHMPSQVAGVSVMFAIPNEQRVGVIKHIQDNIRGIEKKLKTSEAKLESIRKNLHNPIFLKKASREVCEREKNNELVMEDNCKMLRKSLGDLQSLIRNNLYRVFLKHTSYETIINIASP